MIQINCEGMFMLPAEWCTKLNFRGKQKMPKYYMLNLTVGKVYLQTVLQKWQLVPCNRGLGLEVGLMHTRVKFKTEKSSNILEKSYAPSEGWTFIFSDVLIDCFVFYNRMSKVYTYIMLLFCCKPDVIHIYK